MKKLFSIARLFLLIGISLLISCKKDKPAPPVVSTTSTTEISYTSATLGGDVKETGSSPVVTKGICWNTSSGPTTENNKVSQSGGSLGAFVSKMEQLTPATKYFVRAFATSNDGTGYGNEITFTTLTVSSPGVTTTPVTSIKGWSAVSGGIINNENGSPVTEKGICWSTTASPTINDSKSTKGPGTETYSSNVTGLDDGSTYHVRAYATNSAGTGYGEDLTFSTPAVPFAVTDIDGNGYHALTFGTQVWFRENLKTTKYNDGTSIPLVVNNTDWRSSTTNEYCWYNNDIQNKNIYGALYNWRVVDTTMNGHKNVCPVGWRVPNKSEWGILFDYLSSNGYGYGGNGALLAKSIASASGWDSDPTPGYIGNNQNDNNASGFTGLPGGGRQDGDSNFTGLGREAGWWAVPDNVYLGYAYWYNTIASYNNAVWRGATSWNAGVSVRCIKK